MPKKKLTKKQKEKHKESYNKKWARENADYFKDYYQDHKPDYREAFERYRETEKGQEAIAPYERLPKTRKKEKQKKKKQRKPRQPKEKSKLEQLKEKQSQLYVRVSENMQIILNQTGNDEHEFRDLVSKYGYEGLATLEGFDISAPIYDQMVEQFKTYDQIAQTVERLKGLEGKMLIHDSKQMVQEMEEKIQELDKNEAYYTELPNAEGLHKMKKKIFNDN